MWKSTEGFFLIIILMQFKNIFNISVILKKTVQTV